MGNNQHNRPDSSLFSPIVLIAIGVFWLLSNFGILPSIDWGKILRLWPLLLIFWGLNLIFRSAPKPFSALLSALLGVIAVGLFVTIIFFSDTIPILPATVGDAPVVINEAIAVPLEGAESAEVSIETSLVPTKLYALTDSNQLLEGQVSYIGDLILDSDIGSTEAKVKLDTKTQSGWFLDPSNWNQFDDDDDWQIGLTTEIPLDLTIDAGSGSGEYALGQLQLSDFALDGGSGSLSVVLPDGVYDAKVDLASGSSRWTLPADGGGEYDFDVGSGSMSLLIPQGIEAQIEIDRGSGSFSADSRFELISGDEDNGTWQTTGYDAADNRLDIKIDSGSGSVSVELPTGR